ncbi:MAG: hypothetical protein ABFE08_09820, partial [Armatimonadia bacterium]
MPAATRGRQLDWLCVALLGLSALLFWGNCLWGGKVPVAAVYQKQMAPWSATATASASPTRQWDSLLWDSMAQFYSWRLLLHRAGQDGQLPLWNPYQFCGYPFVGNGQSAMFYPPNWLYFAVHPKLGMGLSAALHHFLGALFTFMLARRWKLGRIPALFAAFAFTYGGFMVTWIELPTLVNSLIWLPLAWYALELLVSPAVKEGPRFSRPTRWHAALLLAAALSMTLLAGHLQIAAYVWIFTALYALIRLLTVRLFPTRALSLLVTAVVLAGMLAAVQLLPTLELGRYSARGAGGPSQAGFEFHNQRALQPIELLTLLDPNFFGSPVTGDYQGISYSEHCPFVGAVTILLALAALTLGWRQPRTWVFAGVGIFALWGALGGPPAQVLYWGVPKLGQAGGFSRLLSVWTLAGALWGAVGLQSLMDALRKSKGAEKNVGGATGPDVRRVVAALALILLLVQLLPWAYRFNPRADAAEVYAETAATRKLVEMTGSDRYMAVQDRTRWGLRDIPDVLLPPNAATVYGIRSVDGYDSLYPLLYRQYAAEREGADPAPLANGNMLLTSQTAGWYFPYGASTFIGPETVMPLVSVLPWGGDGLAIVGGGLLERISREAPDPLLKHHAPRREFLLPLKDDLNQVRIDSLRSMKIGLPLPQPLAAGKVLLIDSYYPGWRAYVDGYPREVEPDSGLWLGHSGFSAGMIKPFRSVAMHKGERIV